MASGCREAEMSDKALARYVLAIEAETQKYQKGLDDARRKLDRFQKKQSTDLGKIAKQFSLLALGAATAFGVLLRNSINAQDNLAKLSQQTGVSTEALSQLKFAAELSGTSLEGLTTGLARLSRSASDAANGSATAARAFNAIGVSATGADGSLRKTEDLLLDIAEKFAGLEDGAGKAALAQELFGRSGTQLIPFLNQGRDGIEALTQEAERLGLTVDGKAAAAAERFNDNLSRLKAGTQGVVTQVAGRLLPTMDALSESLVGTSQEAGKLEGAVESLVAGLKLLISTGLAVVASFKAIGTVLGATAAAIVQRDFSIIGQAFDDLRTDAIDQIEGIVNVWKERTGELADNTERDAERVRTALTFGDDADVKQPKLRGINLSDGLKEAIKELENAQREADSVFRRTRTDVENYVSAIQNAQQLLIRGLIDQETFDRWVALHAESFDKIKDEAEETYDMIGEFTKQAARNMQSAFADFLFDPFSNGLSGMLKGFRDTLRRMVAEAASQQILTALFGTLGGSSNSFLAGIGKAFGGARASGGPVSAGKAYLVGEKGPELMVPGASGSIVPNHAMGGSISITVNAEDAGAEGRIRTMIEREMIPQIVNIAQARTIGALSRPSFA
jgi:hypothetical protein